MIEWPDIVPACDCNKGISFNGSWWSVPLRRDARHARVW